MNDDELRSAFEDLLHDLPGDRALPAETARRASRRRTLKLGAGALGGAGAIALAVAVVLGVATPDQDRLVIPADPPTASSAPEPTTQPTASPAPSPSAVPDPLPQPTTGATPGATGQAAPSPQPPARPRLILRPDGLGFTDGGSSTSFLAFGTDGVTVRGAVDRAAGEGAEAQTPDCGAGSSVVQYPNLVLRLQDGEFVGWGTGAAGLSTADGIGIGTALLELREALPGVVVSEGTLGAEWSTVEGGLAGFLDGTQDSSLVTDLAAGIRCLAR